ncbi:MAG: hypothetical protein WCP87_01470 [Atribacterota bacterium]
MSETVETKSQIQVLQDEIFEIQNEISRIERELVKPKIDRAEEVEKALSRMLNDSQTTNELFNYAKQQSEFTKELSGTKAEVDALHGTIETCRIRTAEKQRLIGNLNIRAQQLKTGLPVEKWNLEQLEEYRVMVSQENEARLQGATAAIERKKQAIAIFTQELFDISGETF